MKRNAKVTLTGVTSDEGVTTVDIRIHITESGVFIRGSANFADVPAEETRRALMQWMGEPPVGT